MEQTPIRIYRSGLVEPDSYKGRSGTIQVTDKAGTLIVGVQVKDARLRFGHLDLLVTPTHGVGEKWVESHKVTLAA